MPTNPNISPIQFYEGHMAPSAIRPRQRHNMEDRVDKFAAHMAQHGYGDFPAITTTRTSDSISSVDGHHRRAAAIRAGLPSVPVYGSTSRGIPEGMTEISQERYDEHWNSQ